MHFYSQSEKQNVVSYMCVYEMGENHQKLSII